MTTPSETGPADSLENLVTHVATQLMAVDAATSPGVSQQVLGQLSASFGVDVCFLRYNEHSIRATRLIAEWPPHQRDPDPPLELIYFTDADPVFAAAEHAKEPVFFRPRSDSRGRVPAPR